MGWVKFKWARGTQVLLLLCLFLLSALVILIAPRSWARTVACVCYEDRWSSSPSTGTEPGKLGCRFPTTVNLRAAPRQACFLHRCWILQNQGASFTGGGSPLWGKDVPVADVHGSGDLCVAWAPRACLEVRGPPDLLSQVGKAGPPLALWNPNATSSGLPSRLHPGRCFTFLTPQLFPKLKLGASPSQEAHYLVLSSFSVMLNTQIEIGVGFAANHTY